MKIIAFTREYIVWHYTQAFIDLFYVCRNFLWFINRFFAVTDLFLHFFSPFKRIEEEHIHILKNPSGFFGNLLVNLMMRLVGAILRLSLLALALCGWISVLLLTLISCVLWLVIPCLILFAIGNALFAFTQ